MPEFALMLEGQAGMSWERWRRLAPLAEELGFDGLFRSDHFTNPGGEYDDSLELWTSLTGRADDTDDLAFGPLVTPVSFRDPVFTARMAKEVDDLSGGRLTLGLGAGWQEHEHEAFGYDLLPVPERFDRFEEGLAVIESLLESDEPVSLEGDHYRLDDALLLPRPDRPGGPPLLVGGNGPKRTLPLAAEYAAEWNGVYLTPGEFESRTERLDDLLAERGRNPDDVRRSLMTRVVFGRDEAELNRVLEGRDAEELREEGIIVGTGPEVGEQLDRLEAAGVERVMLQWLALDDLDRLEGLADAIL
jgi:F420-dependent oxidoreductase-like protein